MNDLQQRNTVHIPSDEGTLQEIGSQRGLLDGLPPTDRQADGEGQSRTQAVPMTLLRVQTAGLEQVHPNGQVCP